MVCALSISLKSGTAACASHGDLLSKQYASPDGMHTFHAIRFAEWRALSIR
jgi:hypothetical protein